MNGQLLLPLLILFRVCLTEASQSQDRRNQVLQEAARILELANVSYVYGGNKLGSPEACDRCTACLSSKKPSSDKRLDHCPVCKQCSLDCSHFVSLVFSKAGLYAPYLTSLQMRRLSASQLKSRYHLLDLGNREGRAMPGDLLVYPGHVVMVERLVRPGFGDVVHATSGKEVRGAGQGIQRQTLVPFKSYKGPLQRVLRHKGLQKELKGAFRSGG